jgi:choline dehydrogenase-like flavoprotein
MGRHCRRRELDIRQAATVLCERNHLLASERSATSSERKRTSDREPFRIQRHWTAARQSSEFRSSVRKLRGWRHGRERHPGTGRLCQRQTLGRQYAPLTTSYPDEERSSSQAYLKQALRNGNENLKLYSHTLAKQVIFDDNLTAKAVELQTSSYGNTKSFRLNATREIIISAGAFHSPQLLMVSGIGPRAQLEAHGIDVLVDRPGVGANMEDHLDFAPVWETTIQNDVGSIADPSTRDALVAEYRANRTGPFTNAGVDYIGWEKLPGEFRSNLSAQAIEDLSRFPADWPEVE